MQAYCRRIQTPSPKRHAKRSAGDLTGSVHSVFVWVILVIFFAAGVYLYSVNRTAVQGYQLRTLEEEIQKLKKENAALKIAEADLRSLYRIEGSEEALRMQKIENVIYLEARGSVALK